MSSLVQISLLVQSFGKDLFTLAVIEPLEFTEQLFLVDAPHKVVDNFLYFQYSCSIAAHLHEVEGLP